jgi:hypothetical protein
VQHRRLRRRYGTLALAGGLAGAAALALAPAAAAAPVEAGSGSGSSPAIVGPLLDFFTFGTNVGIPTACQEATSVVGGGAGAYGFAGDVGSLISAINTTCTQVQVEGASFIAQGQADDQALAVFNPFINPAISSTGSSVQSFGDTYGSDLAPFGPTIAGLGGTIDFFEGS